MDGVGGAGPAAAPLCQHAERRFTASLCSLRDLLLLVGAAAQRVGASRRGCHSWLVGRPQAGRVAAQRSGAPHSPVQAAGPGPFLLSAYGRGRRIF